MAVPDLASVSVVAGIIATQQVAASFQAALAEPNARRSRRMFGKLAAGVRVEAVRRGVAREMAERAGEALVKRGEAAWMALHRPAQGQA